MSVTLADPKQTVTLDKARIAAFKVEDNPGKGTYWLEIWVVLGVEVDGVFVEYPDPETGLDAQYIKIENGKHPLDNSQAFGKCRDCGAPVAAIAGVCLEDGCAGEVIPYDGFTRLVTTTPVGSTVRDVIKDCLYAFLASEDVPDLHTGQMRKLLAVGG